MDNDFHHAHYHRANRDGNTYLDHGRMVALGNKIPEIGSLISPFRGIIWEVVRTEPTESGILKIYVKNPDGGEIRWP